MSNQQLTHQQEHCSDSKCPINTSDFIARLNHLEDEMNESRTHRHDRNAAYAKIMDEIRLNILEHEGEIKELRIMHKEVIDALKGVMGRSGLIAENIAQEQRIKDLEDWRKEIRSFIAGAIAICSFISAGLTYLVMFFKGGN